MTKLLWPLKGIGVTPGIYITQYFGQKLNDYAQFGMKGHNGIDIAAPKGTPVLAVHDGKVEHFTDNGYGINARLFFNEEGNQYEVTYGHFWKYEGGPRAVKEGEVIGYVDSTGFSTGHHLHFGIRQYGFMGVENYNNGYFGYVDPLPLMKTRDFFTGYRKHPEKNLTVRFSNMDEYQLVREKIAELLPNHQFEDVEFTMPLDKPPFPTP